MRFPIRRYIWLLLYCLLISMATPATEATTPAIDTQWQQLISDQAFGYKDQKEAIEKIKPQEENVFEKVMLAIYSFFMSSTGKIIIWVIFFLLLGWALFKIFFGAGASLFGRTPKKAIESEPEVIERDLLDTNWETHLQDALNKQDLRQVVRYSYMRLLQLLQQRSLIQYRSDKTNYDYYAELSHAEYKQPFRQLTRQYEYAWYGNFPLSTEAYEEYMNTFNQLKNRLKN